MLSRKEADMANDATRQVFNDHPELAAFAELINEYLAYRLGVEFVGSSSFEQRLRAAVPLLRQDIDDIYKRDIDDFNARTATKRRSVNVQKGDKREE
jgi:hypothetical protein